MFLRHMFLIIIKMDDNQCTPFRMQVIVVCSMLIIACYLCYWLHHPDPWNIPLPLPHHYHE